MLYRANPEDKHFAIIRLCLQERWRNCLKLRAFHAWSRSATCRSSYEYI